LSEIDFDFIDKVDEEFNKFKNSGITLNSLIKNPLNMISIMTTLIDYFLYISLSYKLFIDLKSKEFLQLKKIFSKIKKM